MLVSDCCGFHSHRPCYSVYVTHIYTNPLLTVLVVLVSSRKIIINRSM